MRYHNKVVGSDYRVEKEPICYQKIRVVIRLQAVLLLSVGSLAKFLYQLAIRNGEP